MGGKMSPAYKLEWQRRKHAAFTPEQREEYNLMMRNYQKASRSKKTPEEVASLREKERIYRAGRRAEFSPEKRAAIREQKRLWSQKARSRERAKYNRLSRDWARRFRQTPRGAIEMRLRERLRKAVTRYAMKEVKAGSTMELVGCTREFLKGWIEAQFRDGMSWERIGEIHIDHVRPVSSFDLSNPEQQRACFHYSNLQPLWAIDNLRKTNKIVSFRKAA